MKYQIGIVCIKLIAYLFKEPTLQIKLGNLNPKYLGYEFGHEG